MCAFLAACQGQVTVDLATDISADRSVRQVNVTLTGLEFRRDDGSTKRLSFRDGQPVNLFSFLDGNSFRVFTDEELPDGNYDGVRLTFEDDPDVDPEVVTAGGDRFPLSIVDGDYASVNFSIQDNESSDDDYTLTLDLRQSLVFDDGDDEYTLRPYLRSVATDRDGQVTGTVSINCPAGGTLPRGGAVYLFTGNDVDPDDRDGAGVEPYATTDVYTTTNNQFGYALRFLPEGNYTIAITCDGDEDSPDTDDSNDMAFRLIDNVRVTRDRTLVHDFSN